MWLVGFSEASSVCRWRCRVARRGLRTLAACPDTVDQPPSHSQPAHLRGVKEGLLQSGVHQGFIHASDVPRVPHSRASCVAVGPYLAYQRDSASAAGRAATRPGHRDPPAPPRTPNP
jgi:hypothetical protein